MAESTCLAAFTAPGGSYPPYTNLTLCNDDKGNEFVAITVRSESRFDPREGGYWIMGSEAKHVMPLPDFKRMIGEAISELMLRGAHCDPESRAIIKRAIGASMDLDKISVPDKPAGKCNLSECLCRPPYDKPGHKAKCPNWIAGVRQPGPDED